MPTNFILYDAFTRLNKPDVRLVRLGMDHDGAFYLDGYPHVELVAPVLIENNWVRRLMTTEDQIFWTISYDGYKVFMEIQKWYNSLKWYQKILGRVGFEI